MIPKNIEKAHVLRAIQEIDSVGIQNERLSRKFQLKYNGKNYPPKYLLSIANKYANGQELLPSDFSGGNESNNFLRALGFEITSMISTQKPIATLHKEPTQKDETKHDERCRKCKEHVMELLERVYGIVQQNHKFTVRTHPDDLSDTVFNAKLKEIHAKLQNHRGFKGFVKAETLPNCDYFVPVPGFVVEFDESQHFTEARKLVLEDYPHELQLGFDRQRWMELCGKIKARDNDPPYRDEQRAWYDTLRDFLPTILGLKPTVRLFAKDFVWCSLNPEKRSDVERFAKLMQSETGVWKIKVREDSEPFLARVIVAGKWDGKIGEAKRVLECVYENWPKGKKVKFLVTCGGFVQFDWPESVTRPEIGDNKNPNRKALSSLVGEAERCARSVIDDDLREKLREVTDYVTLGIDSYKEQISTTSNLITKPHIELVLLADLKKGEFRWTGKSYPTSPQQDGLVRVVDLGSHFLELDLGKVMILGCHDLTIFNPRSKNATGWRKKVNNEFRALSRKENPDVVLQHPHTTDSILTWAAAWSRLRKTFPQVKVYAGAGRYYNDGKEARSELADVLRKTKQGETIDFIITT